MKIKPIIIIITASLTLYGCTTSKILYTTDLNKIRNNYNEAQHQINVDKIDIKRQKSIKIDKSTIYSDAIQCLSPSFDNQMAISNNSSKIFFRDRLIGINNEITRLENNIKNIKRNGNYTKIIRNRDSSDSDVHNAISIDRIFDRSLNEYAVEIRKLEAKINILYQDINHNPQKNPNDLINLIAEKERISLEFEDLKKELIYNEKELQEKKLEQGDLTKKIEKIDNESSQANDTFKISVANIYDKTGKVFDRESTAISEMVAHALLYNYGIKLVDIPFGNNWSNSRYNPLNENSRSTDANKNIALLSSNTGFAGVVFPSDMYISGALVQYDQTPSTYPFGTRLSVNLDPLDTSAETQTLLLV